MHRHWFYTSFGYLNNHYLNECILCDVINISTSPCPFTVQVDLTCAAYRMESLDVGNRRQGDGTPLGIIKLGMLVEPNLPQSEQRTKDPDYSNRPYNRSDGHSHIRLGTAVFGVASA